VTRRSKAPGPAGTRFSTSFKPVLAVLVSKIQPDVDLALHQHATYWEGICLLQKDAIMSQEQPQTSADFNNELNPTARSQGRYVAASNMNRST